MLLGKLQGIRNIWGTSRWSFMPVPLGAGVGGGVVGKAAGKPG